MRMRFKRSELWGPSLASVWRGNYASEEMNFQWGGDHAMSMVYKGFTQTGRPMRTARYMVPIEGETQRVNVEDRSWEVSKFRYDLSAYGQKDLRLQKRRGSALLVADNVTIEHAEHLLNAFQDACLRDASLTGIGRGSRKLPQHFSCFDAVVPSAS